MSKKVVATFVLELLMVGIAGVSQATDLTANVSVDDAFEMYVSTDDCQLGTLVCSSEQWQTATPCAITLTPGVPNYIHVVGRDMYTVIASFLGDFKLSDTDFTFSNGTDTLLTNETGDWKVYTDDFCGTEGVLTSQGANSIGPWGLISGIDPLAQWIWTGNGYDMTDPRYFSTVITPTPVIDEIVKIPITGIITTRNWEYGNDEAQFKLAEMQGIKDAAQMAIDAGLDMTIAFGTGVTCNDPIYQKIVPASDLTATYLNLRYIEGGKDVLRCVHNSGQCVINIKPEELKSLTDSIGNTLDKDLLTGEMTVCLKVGNTTYTNTGMWKQEDSGSGSWTKFRRVGDVPAP